MRRRQLIMLAAMLLFSTLGSASDRRMADLVRIDRSIPVDLPTLPSDDAIDRYDDWVVQQNDTFSAARTYGDHDSMFGILCEQNCAYFADAHIPCDDGSEGAGMVSTAAGTLAVTLRCIHIRDDGDDEQLLLIDQDLGDALEGTERMTLSIATADGEMHVYHFSMRGADEAQRAILDRPEDDDVSEASSIA